MNKKICIATWVYGRKYQGWVPLYVYSIRKNYPEYDIKILCDRKLSIGIKKILKKYNLFDSVEYFEDVASDFGNCFKNEIEKRCFRWLTSGYGIEDYEYVYWGDIDIYIVKEDIPLLQQHLDDLKKNKRNYSNAIRITLKDYMKKRMNLNKKLLFRLTGLHFVKTAEYYKAVRKYQNKILLYMTNKRVKLIDDIFLKDDERCLWLLNFVSKNGFPKKSYELTNDAFRPLHGVHFAVGRAFDEYTDIFRQNSKNKDEHYINYIKFRNEYNSDSVLRRLVYDSPYYIINIIEKICYFWGGSLNTDEIKSL